MVSVVANSSLEEKLSFGHYRVNDAMADGEGVIVYVMDSGHNPDPQRDTNEQIFFPGKVEFPQQDGDFKPTTEPRKLTDDLFKNANPKFKVVGEPTGPEVRDVSQGQHGPSMSALIGASKVGVAPRCRVAPLRCTIDEELDIKECIKCCETILTYHNKKHAGKPAVVNCSLTIPYQNLLKKIKANGSIPVESLENETEILFGKFQKAVESLANAGMIIVASGGNQKHTTNTTWAEWKADQAAAFLSGIMACILSSAQYKAKAQSNVDNARKHIRQILEKVSEDFDDGNGNRCRAFMAGTIDLKNVDWEYKV
ncbi:hypothetical protein HYE67_000151 [Fusarium culmorum]|uniref:Peptidase S8/S53 domain-containing protein n=1 Tax=Fusarium culmorum TaxID=5516 RepID=A0A7S8CX37_FUSCU|nr:hypothetical protein HYE67_000151 [Fusarium culmorum]